MGVLTKIRNGIVRAAAKTADGVASLSQLSPAQVGDIDKKRVSYLSDMPSIAGDAAEEIIQRNLGAISIEVYHSYLQRITDLYLPIQEADKFDGVNRISYFEVSKWVKDPDENNLEKLMNVYQVLSEDDCNIALIYQRSVTGVTIYLAVVNNGAESDPSEVESYKERLLGAITGNFPGAELVTEKSGGFGANVPECLDLDDAEGKKKRPKSVATVSNLATEKSEKFVSQTIEKVLDGIVPKKKSEEYTIVLLATPVREQFERKNRLFELYTGLAPYANWQTNFTYTESSNVGSSSTAGINLGASVGSQSGTSQSEGTSESISNSSSTSTTDTVGTSMTATESASGGIKGVGEVSASVSETVTASHAKTKTTGLTKTIAKVASNAVSAGSNIGFNAGVNFARSSNVSVTVGKNEGITQSFVNYGVKHTLEVLEKQVQRLEMSSALGLWDFAAYVLSEDSVIANNVAYTYLALTQGEESFLEESAVNLWRADLPDSIDTRGEKNQAESIMVSLSRLQHPEFCLKMVGENAVTEDYLMYPSCVTATASISGKELARALNFPGKSVCGLPVIETAAFGRGISSYHEIAKDFTLGKVYHMHRPEQDAKVELSKKSLASHVFVTGSTGAGKTNTVTEMLKKIVLDNQVQGDTHFLVVEPAKGEYRDVLGGYEGVSVYGTNPNFSLLLRINPFAFPGNIAVGEHIDRLTEIFNVCWPMYAAMPAILKDAIIRAYEVAGWDIDTSQNRYQETLFPGFVDVMEQVKLILGGSEYSADTKGDYTGALVARLKSLTNGINGQIFTTYALSDEELFDRNVIVDMSRVGSVETKSLIMGLLVMKLQEYRLSESKPNVKGLAHITVLEEAHNLLRRTSIEQSSESANLLGKSVEMLTNSIAELRAFGEGFIIADQAPGLLDMAVIRNTNTKIVHRLPDQSDRELVGKAMGMSDAQIQELSKLATGVAAVYQNEWIEPVLCQVDLLSEEEKKGNDETGAKTGASAKQIKAELMDYLLKKELAGKGNRADLERLCKLVIKSQAKVAVKRDLLDYMEQGCLETIQKLVFDLADADFLKEKATGENTQECVVKGLTDILNSDFGLYTQEEVDRAVGLMIRELYTRNASYHRVYLEYGAGRKEVI